MFEFLKLVWFAIAVFPALVINEGYLKLKAFLGKHGIEWDWYKMTLVFLIILLYILYSAGYRW